MSMEDTKKVPTPELDKMQKVQEASQAIGAFLDSMREHGYVMCEENSRAGWETLYFPSNKNIEQLIALHFDVDLVKAEKEREALLAAIRA